MKPLFRTGQFLATRGALSECGEQHVDIFTLLVRHATGDWGNVPPEDAKANAMAVYSGARIISSYPLPRGGNVWLITEADRSTTTLLLPEEY